MFDPDTGEVDRATVIRVLNHYGVETSDDPHNAGCVVLIKGTIVEAKTIPDMVGRRLLQYFKRTYTIPIHHFYHPEMMDQGKFIQ